VLVNILDKSKGKISYPIVGRYCHVEIKEAIQGDKMVFEKSDMKDEEGETSE
jgi:hypothetical protein